MANVFYAGTRGAAETSALPEYRISVEHTELVQRSYRLVEPASDLVATLFFTA